ncbi:hypothetical protein EMMF5_004874 [Cystobasidiomycetes sp. EMM_F5]
MKYLSTLLGFCLVGTKFCLAANPVTKAYEDFGPTTSELGTAGTINTLSGFVTVYDTQPNTLTAAKAACSANTACIGFLLAYQANAGGAVYQLYSSPGPYNGVPAPPSVQVNYFSWRYNANPGTGPRCSSLTDTFSMNNMCNCLTSAGERQDPKSNAGCLSILGSPVVRRNLLQKDRRVPGKVPKPYFLKARQPQSSESLVTPTGTLTAPQAPILPALF